MNPASVAEAVKRYGLRDNDRSRRVLARLFELSVEGDQHEIKALLAELAGHVRDGRN